MIVRLTFKTPDVVCNETEMPGINDCMVEEIEDACSKWVEYGEYLRVDIDTETGECTPVPVSS